MKSSMKKLKINSFSLGKGEPLTILCGPCVIEGEDDALLAAKKLSSIFNKHGVNLVYKSSYDKANRMSISTYRGPGIQEGLRILEKVKKEFNLPIISDIHSPEEAKIAAEVLDIIQIPAFLCRQTDLLVAAGETNRIINVKKGQFMAPNDMKNIVEKLLSTNNDKIILTDRGVSFGYHNLVSDMRAIPIMQEFGFPVCFDASHSVQLPGGQGKSSGGQSQFIPVLAKAALAAGADLLFIESHPNPKNAKSDQGSQLSFEEIDRFLPILKSLHKLIQHES